MIKRSVSLTGRGNYSLNIYSLAPLHILIHPTTEIKNTTLGDEDLKLPEPMGPFTVCEPLILSRLSTCTPIKIYHRLTFRKFSYFNSDYS